MAKRIDIRKIAARPGAWGCLVGTPEQAALARERGASWLVASHASALTEKCPAAVAGLLPYADANGFVLARGADILAAAGQIPVLAGVLAMDQFRRLDTHLNEIAQLGFAGIHTFPSVGILDGGYRELLESAGLGWTMETDAVRRAADRGLFACGTVFSAGHIADMVAAGAAMTAFHPPLGRGDAPEWDRAAADIAAESASASARTGRLSAAFIPRGAGPGPAGVPPLFETPPDRDKGKRS